MTAAGRAPAVVAILGPTASGKSALGLALARRFDGEIVACDSTAVYRGFDIGTDKVPAGEQGGIPHHCVDIVDPDAEYTAADYARDAMAAIRSIHARGRLPILVGGTGLYYRALASGIFPGPGRDDDRARASGRAGGAAGARAAPPAARPHRPRVGVAHPGRATGSGSCARSRSTSRAAARSPTTSPTRARPSRAGPSWASPCARPGRTSSSRIARRVDAQFARGIEDEVRALLARGVPPGARPFTGYVYRHVLEVVRGERDRASARELIVTENRHYARRQLIWFRKEPNLVWIQRAGEDDDARLEAAQLIDARLGPSSHAHPRGEHPTHATDS